MTYAGLEKIINEKIKLLIKAIIVKKNDKVLIIVVDLDCFKETLIVIINVVEINKKLPRQSINLLFES
jgi:hypothetical protein